ncbi:MAG: serine hydrolase [Thermoproteota archaeon]|uniref:Serine hydrolase n=1 Tax=Candidatus Methanodesulfokora washburnensis TaxID=2478471 RepID=A0A520KIY7_9CREN|nr:MAG: serine hydrolase [Candidatus Methanodesulfokores washburnensis]TDA41048.1 MAG: serine hydrolase [Candidatus Korarchaeota archaeon]
MPDLSSLEEFIQRKMSLSKIPGLSISLVSERGIYSKGFGFRDVEKGLPATNRTVYGIGSITKSFTALSVMKLVEEGRVSLEDEVSKYVPVDVRPLGEPIRIKHLLTHTSGIPALGYAEAFIKGALELDSTWFPAASADDIAVFLRGSESWAVSRPGERFFYLNEGYVLLGRVIERASGMKYEDYVRKNILVPLKMDRTYFDAPNDPDVASSYIVDRKMRCIRSRFPYGITSDGGILSNPIDMANYIQMYINRGEGILSRESIELMEKKHVDVPDKLFGDDGYGYGLMVTDNFLERKMVFHSGSVLVHTAFMGYVPEERIGVAVMCNSSGYPPSFIGMYALAVAMGEDPMKLRFIKEDEIMERLQGIYETYRGCYRICIRKRGGLLYLEHRDRYTESSFPLIPIEISEDHSRFYTLSYGRRINVEFSGEEMIYERYRMIRSGRLC